MLKMLSLVYIICEFNLLPIITSHIITHSGLLLITKSFKKLYFWKKIVTTFQSVSSSKENHVVLKIRPLKFRKIDHQTNIHYKNSVPFELRDNV